MRSSGQAPLNEPRYLGLRPSTICRGRARLIVNRTLSDIITSPRKAGMGYAQLSSSLSQGACRWGRKSVWGTGASKACIFASAAIGCHRTRSYLVKNGLARAESGANKLRTLIRRCLTRLAQGQAPATESLTSVNRCTPFNSSSARRGQSAQRPVEGFCGVVL